MAARRLPMRKFREILRLLLSCSLGVRETARCCGVSHATVLEYRQRASSCGLDWPELSRLDDLRLERTLFPSLPQETSRPVPDWSEIHTELKKSGVTLQLLWEEYKSVHPDGYQYSRFCDLYRVWRGRLDLSMRQEHRAGEKLFVDYCGQTVAVTDPSTGATRRAQIFVAVLGASNYTFAEATWSQSLPDWIGSHVRAFAFFGGVTSLVVPDNLRSAVSKACRYEPTLNRTYQDLASHYETAVIPARVRHPKDKAKVEVGVQVVERWILACLRRRTFFSLAELNATIREHLERLNLRAFKKLPGNRRSQFEALDRPALKPLPATAFEYADWQTSRVRSDYHVEVEGHYYSVPYQLVDREIEVRLTGNSVEFLHQGCRVACHARSRIPGQSTTCLEHMPRAHREYAEWTSQKLISWAEQSGPSTSQLIEAILKSRSHPHQGFHSCLGLRRLAGTYGTERLEAACRRALRIQGLSYKSVRSILQRGLDRQEPRDQPAAAKAVAHDNVRGSTYYRTSEEEEQTSC